MNWAFGIKMKWNVCIYLFCCNVCVCMSLIQADQAVSNQRGQLWVIIPHTHTLAHTLTLQSSNNVIEEEKQKYFFPRQCFTTSWISSSFSNFKETQSSAKKHFTKSHLCVFNINTCWNIKIYSHWTRSSTVLPSLWVFLRLVVLLILFKLCCAGLNVFGLNWFSAY